MHTGLSLESALMELFCTAGHRVSIMPRNLSYLVNKMPVDSWVSIERLVYEHTYFPFFEPFLSERKAIEIKSVLYSSQPSKSFASRWIGNIRFSLSSEVKYCKQCIKEDYEKYGECYIHRSHQVFGVVVCAMHSVQLFTNCPQCLKPLANLEPVVFLATPYCQCGHSLVDTILNKYDFHPSQKQFSVDVKFLFDHPRLLSNDAVRAQYEYWEIKHGYRTEGVRVGGSHFANAITAWLPLEFYPLKHLINQKTILRLIKCNISSGIHFPSFHLICMQFLSGSMKKFLDLRGPTLLTKVPFPIGPWPCLNQFCEHFKENVIQKCVRKKRSGKHYFTGIFSCPYCGYTYSKRWDGLLIFGNYKHRVRSYGQLWESRFLETYIATGQIRPTSREMGVARQVVRKILAKFERSSAESTTRKSNYVSDVISTLAIRLGVTPEEVKCSLGKFSKYSKRELSFNKVVSEASASKEVTTRLSTAREQIRSILKLHPNTTRSEIAKIAGYTYLWLSRHDKEWLSNILPAQRCGVHLKINWQMADRELEQIIPDAVQKALESNPNKRVTKGTILSQLPHVYKKRLEYRPDDLPRSIRVLNSSIESIDEFSIRFLPWAVKQMRRNCPNRVIYLQQLQVKFATFRKCSKETCKKIEVLLQQYNSQIPKLDKTHK